MAIASIMLYYRERNRAQNTSEKTRRESLINDCQFVVKKIEQICTSTEEILNETKPIIHDMYIAAV